MMENNPTKNELVADTTDVNTVLKLVQLRRLLRYFQ